MKKVLFTIGMIAVLVGVAFAGMAASPRTGGAVGMETFAGSTFVLHHPIDSEVLLEKHFNQVRHISLTMSRSCEEMGLSIGIELDTDGDGSCESYFVPQTGCYQNNVQLDAWGFRVTANYFSTEPVDWEGCVNATTTFER